jgi:putative hydrolase of HD superfamily
MEKVNVNKVVQMCLLHDLTESRCGDQNWIHKRYVKVDENKISIDQFSPLPNSKDLIKLMREYNERKTPEANIAKDADRLDQTLLEREYVHMGNMEAKSWGRTNRINLYSKSAKKLLKEIISQTPSDWWTHGLWTDKRLA